MVDANHEIADYMLVASQTCLRLFVIYVTSEDGYRAGNRIVRFCVIKGREKAEIKEYEVHHKDELYTNIYATTKINRDRVFYATSLLSKSLHLIETKRGVSI